MNGVPLDLQLIILKCGAILVSFRILTASSCLKVDIRVRIIVVVCLHVGGLSAQFEANGAMYWISNLSQQLICSAAAQDGVDLISLGEM